MSDFFEFIGTGKKPPVQTGFEIEGSFLCNFCFGYADSAYYDDSRDILKYTCENNHLNTIEDFNL